MKKMAAKDKLKEENVSVPNSKGSFTSRPVPGPIISQGDYVSQPTPGPVLSSGLLSSAPVPGPIISSGAFTFEPVEGPIVSSGEFYIVPTPGPIVSEGQVAVAPKPGGVLSAGTFHSRPLPGPALSEGEVNVAPTPGGVLSSGPFDSMPVPGPILSKGEAEVAAIIPSGVVAAGPFDSQPIAGPILQEGEPGIAPKPDGFISSGPFNSRPLPGPTVSAGDINVAPKPGAIIASGPTHSEPLPGPIISEGEADIAPKPDHIMAEPILSEEDKETPELPNVSETDEEPSLFDTIDLLDLSSTTSGPPPKDETESLFDMEMSTPSINKVEANEVTTSATTTEIKTTTYTTPITTSTTTNTTTTSPNATTSTSSTTTTTTKTAPPTTTTITTTAPSTILPATTEKEEPLTATTIKRSFVPVWIIQATTERLEDAQIRDLEGGGEVSRENSKVTSRFGNRPSVRQHTKTKETMEEDAEDDKKIMEVENLVEDKEMTMEAEKVELKIVDVVEDVKLYKARQHTENKELMEEEKEDLEVVDVVEDKEVIKEEEVEDKQLYKERQHTQHKEMMDKINELTAANYLSADQAIDKEEREREIEVGFYEEQPRSTRGVNKEEVNNKEVLDEQQRSGQVVSKEQELEHNDNYKEELRSKSAKFIVRHGSLQQILALRKSIIKENKEEEKERSSSRRSPIFIGNVTNNGDFDNFSALKSADSGRSFETNNNPVVRVTVESAREIEAGNMDTEVEDFDSSRVFEGESRVNNLSTVTPEDTATKSQSTRNNHDDEERENRKPTEDMKKRPSSSGEQPTKQKTMSIQTEELEKVEAESANDDGEDDKVLSRSKSTTALNRAVSIQKPTHRVVNPTNHPFDYPSKHLLPLPTPGYVLRGQLYQVVQPPRLRFGHPGFGSVQTPPYPPSFLPSLLQYPGRVYPVYRSV